jgi:cytochrome P450
MSERSEVFNPEYNAETGNAGPEVFDGLRYARLRDQPGLEAKHQTVTTSLDYLVFGHGRGACPGRFFAIYEIKMLLIQFLRNYDLRLPGDVEGKGRDSPPFIYSKMSRSPDPRTMLEIRHRDES